MKKVIKVIIVLILWIVEYFFIIGGSVMLYGEPAPYMPRGLFMLILVVYLVICWGTWKLIMRKYKSNKEGKASEEIEKSNILAVPNDEDEQLESE
jgi:ABC-type nickel/cobalt efflux system permease component RcnA